MTIKKKIAISITIVIAAIGLIIYFIILPTIKDIEAISEAVYAERVDLEKKYLRGQLLKKTVENFQKIEPEKDKLVSIFINEGEELKFITALERIAASHGLVQNLKLQTRREGSNNYYPLPLEITTKGRFIQTLRYLKDLERLNYYFNIFSLNLSNGEGGNLITGAINGEIYVLPPREEEE
jgi:Tfp pilus assembly protein PilO